MGRDLGPPGTLDREGVIESLDVHEQDASVRGKGGTAELIFVRSIGIAGEGEDLPIGGHTPQMLELLSLEGIDEVLADNEVPVGSDTEVVPTGQEITFSGFEEEFDLRPRILCAFWNDTENLAPPARAAIGAAEEEGTLVVEDSLPPGKAGCALLESSHPEVVLGRGWIIDFDPVNGEALTLGDVPSLFGLVVAQIGGLDAADGEGVEPSGAEVSLPFRDKPVEQTIAPVLRQVEAAVFRVVGHGFVAEAPQCFQGNGLLESQFGVGLDLEAVTVHAGPTV